MNLKQKIAQMFIFGFQGALPGQLHHITEEIRRYNPGGVWLTDRNNPDEDPPGNIISPEQLRCLTDHLQCHAKTPMFIAIDAEGGAVIRLNERYGFPPTRSAASLGGKNDVTATYRQYRRIALSLRQAGINFNFAPVVDLNLRPDNPALGGKGRCFSANPHIVGIHASAAIDAMHCMGILTCLKHFPGHGSVAEDSHKETVDITYSWRREELHPYITLTASGYNDAVLSAHVIHRGVDARFPASLSPKWSAFLRKEMRFNGLLLTDDLNMRAIRGTFPYREALLHAINAGYDLLVHSNFNPQRPNLIGESVETVYELVKNGMIDRKKIEHACHRILSVKRNRLF